MNCWYCERPAHGVCRFCGRAVCKQHTTTMPSIISLYVNSIGLTKAIVVDDTLYCGICKLKEEPVEMPELK
ncbi:hypothetical protein [Desulfosporosinus sp. Sb-LF]|uniref:hypothetical protein n=1 Tax=Desulfosporosinus sp. Sb-LF TaxID=2560027 RepID=UPI00107F96BF|nr:hypothetical protein [Desulfosporosinus sp. Sb-LF]TGE30964.1 hypothetical protein E4K68_19880 [Desulfosporosinus sp. Sb-LF]